jgi:hypothetical protein
LVKAESWLISAYLLYFIPESESGHLEGEEKEMMNDPALGLGSSGTVSTG